MNYHAIKSFLRTIIFFFILIMLTSCLTIEKRIEYLKPAEISIPQDIKTIAILSKGRRYRDIIYDILFNTFGREDVRKRFDLIDRKNLDLILHEQNLYNNDEFDDKTAAMLGELSGAQAIVVGELRNIRDTLDHGTVVLNRRYIERYETTSRGSRIPVYAYYSESIPSIIKTYMFTIDIRMLDITKGTLLHNEQKTYKFQYENYIDNRPSQTVSVIRRNAKFVNNFPEMEELLIKSGKDFADYFARKVAPFSVTELMSFEIIPKDGINDRFIKFVDSDLYDEAFEVMIDALPAIDSMDDHEARSMHYYNMGCIYEIKSDLEKSFVYYNKAVKDDPSDLHLEALKAIKDRIDEKKRLDEQLNSQESVDDQNW